MVAAFEIDLPPVMVKSLYFGEFRRDPASEVRLPLGLPGFESERALIAIEIPEQRPLVYLHSILNPNLCFLSMPAGSILPDFDFVLGEEERTALGFTEYEPLVLGRNLLVLALLYPVDGSLRVNLAAPLVVNIEKMIGVQCVLESAPEHPHMKLSETGQWVPAC